MASPSDLDNWAEMLTVGPFGGLDPTTPPYYVAPTNFVSGENFVPNHGYGGFITVMGRNVALQAPLPGPCNGMHVFHRQGLPDVYLFALDLDAGTQSATGAIAWAPLGGAATVLELPNNMTLTPGQQTFFADSQDWVFITNGADRPLKIDTTLLVTYWGILAPTEAPALTLAGQGPLLGQYNYCFTWGNDVQESSQGVISSSITCSQSTAKSSALQLTGNFKKGDIVTIYVGQEGEAEYGVSYTIPDPPPPDLTTLAEMVVQNFNISPYVTQYAFASAPTQADVPKGQIVLTAAQPGAGGNTIYTYGAVIHAAGGGGGLSIMPSVRTALTGGTDGGTVLINVPNDLVPNDPQVTQLNLYRIGGSLGTWNLITTLDPKATHYYDAKPDQEVTGQQLIIFRDAPPPFKYIAQHMERIFAFNIPVDYNPTPQYDIKADASVMWWSNLNEPWGFNSEVNNFTCGDNKFSDVGVGLMELGGVLMALKTRRCYFIYGTTDDDFQAVFAWFIGCDAPLSIATGYGLGFWHSRQGVHMTDGSTKNQISDAGFRQSNVKNILDALTDADFAKSVGFMYDRQYYLSIPTQRFTLLYDTRDQQWYKMTFSLSQVAYDLESNTPVVGMDDKIEGQVDKWFDSPCDFGGTISARLTSRTSDGGSKAGTKRLERGLLIAPVQPGVCAKVIVTGDPDCVTQTSAPEQLDLGRGFQRHEWGIAATASGTLDCDTFNVTICVDGPAIVDSVSVWGWVVRVHALGPSSRSEFESAGAT